jgi:alkaline phosphatase
MKSWLLGWVTLIVLSVPLCSQGLAAQDDSTGQSDLPRLVILMIGDGMGHAYLDMTRQAGAEQQGDPDYRLAMDALSVRANLTNQLHGRYVTDSAASGTAIACGQHFHMNAVSVGRDKKKPLRTIVDAATERGWRSGILSSVSLDHATPACFYAHHADRKQYSEIARQLFSSSVDFFGGGGFASEAFRDAETLQTQASAAGFTLARTLTELAAVAAGTRVLAINAHLDDKGALPDHVTSTENDLSLALLLQEALRLLANETGVLLIVEGGKIDWAGHAQDEALALGQMQAFDQAVAVALELVRSRSDSLLIVTSDHETGNLQATEAGFRFQHARHTAKPVPLLAKGLQADRFSRDMSNVELGQALFALLEHQD